MHALQFKLVPFRLYNIHIINAGQEPFLYTGDFETSLYKSWISIHSTIFIR